MTRSETLTQALKSLGHCQSQLITPTTPAHITTNFSTAITLLTTVITSLREEELAAKKAAANPPRIKHTPKSTPLKGPKK